MRRTLSPRRNALLSSADLSWGAWALAAALFLFFVRILAPDLFFRAAEPLFKSADALSERSKAFFSSFGDAGRLALENEALLLENAALRLENEAAEKNIRARAALGAQGNGIVASVVARPPESPYDALLLSRGAEDGVSVGMRVFALSSGGAREEEKRGGVPVGTISSVTDRFSRALLFSAPGVSTYGWIGTENIPVTLLGQGGGAMRATLPRSVPVSVGDVVYAPGPEALPLGRVARIDEDASSPSLTLHVASLANLFSATWVMLRDLGGAPAPEPVTSQPARL